MGNQETIIKEKRLILSALPYANNIPHIGNLVGSHLPADIFARYCRLAGYNTILIGGTDENGSPTEIASIQFGIPAQKLVDTFHKIHKQIYDWFGISYDNFSRTSKPIHHKTAQDFFEILYHKGFILEKQIKLPYCEKCDLSLPDRYVEGICPNCGYEKARGDQCDKCTKLLDPLDLKKPKCQICGSTPKIRKSKHLFIDLPRIQKKLEEWVLSNTQWKDHVTALTLGWLKEGLKERCITRDLKFGIDVPLPEYSDKKLYVWVEAVLGYISSTKEWAEKQGHPGEWEKYWKENDAKSYYFMGKDNVPFHTILFPALLIAHGGFNLPYQVVGLQYCNYEGDKISKSRSWGVFCEKLASSGVDVDIWRFYLSNIIPETKDSEFKWDEFEARVNSDLIGNFGNFVNRTLSFLYNHLDKTLNHHELTARDMELVKKIEKTQKEVTDLFEQTKIREALHKILELSAEGNRYFQENKPWELKKTDLKRCETVIYLCTNLCLNLAILVQPFLPSTSKKIFDQLDVKEKFKWSDANKINLKKGHRISEPQILFKQLDKLKIDELKNTVTKPTPLEEIFQK